MLTTVSESYKKALEKMSESELKAHWQKIQSGEIPDGASKLRERNTRQEFENRGLVL